MIERIDRCHSLDQRGHILNRNEQPSQEDHENHAEPGKEHRLLLAARQGRDYDAQAQTGEEIEAGEEIQTRQASGNPYPKDQSGKGYRNRELDHRDQPKRQELAQK